MTLKEALLQKHKTPKNKTRKKTKSNFFLFEVITFDSESRYDVCIPQFGYI